MAAHSPDDAPLGTPAPDFSLPGVDGRFHTLGSARGPNGLVVAFVCNHCPYVQAVVGKMVRDARDLAAAGVGFIAISSNDPDNYPEDSFDNMKRFSALHGFPFAYVFDETQAIAKAYTAVCTPEFFGFDRDLRLAYRGRLDDSARSPKEGNRRDLYEAMVAVARGGAAPADQRAAIGCSIKWRMS